MNAHPDWANTAFWMVCFATLFFILKYFVEYASYATTLL